MFTNVVSAVVASLRVRGVSVAPYLDDWLLLARTRALLLQNLQLTVERLSNLGRIINWEKSPSLPQIQFLRFLIETLLFLFLGYKSRAFTRVFPIFSLTLRTVARLLGLISAAIEAIAWARAHMRPLQWEFLARCSKSPKGLDNHCVLFRVLCSLVRWKTPPNGRAFAPVHRSYLTTDASQLGYRVHPEALTAQGSWSTLKSLFSNMRELWHSLPCKEPYRQHYGCSTYKQARRNEIILSSGRGSGNSFSSAEAPDQPNCSVQYSGWPRQTSGP